MRRLPQSVASCFPDPAGLPFPCSGITGLQLFLASQDPAAVHDAFLASALVGQSGSVECWLDPGQDPQPGSNNTATAGHGGAAHARQAAAEAVTLANEQLADWAGMLGIVQPGNLEFKLQSLLTHQPPPSTFHLAAVAGLPLALPDALASTLAALYATLKPGGELFVCALLCNRRLERSVTAEALEAAGVGPVLYFEDFLTALRTAGFLQPRILRMEAWDLQGLDDDSQYLLLHSKLSTFHIRAQKNRLLDATCEDYGQWAVYKGSLEGSDEAYTLDMHHRLVKNQPTMVCGNTAAMLGEQGVSWLSPHFVITGDRSVHYGSFSGRLHGARTDGCCL